MCEIECFTLKICKIISLARSLVCWEHLQDVLELNNFIWVGNDDDVQSLQCSGGNVISEYGKGDSSVTDDRMRLKHWSYNEEVIGYATVQAACDLDIGRERCKKGAYLSHFNVYWLNKENIFKSIIKGACSGVLKPALPV
ncbi:UNVERIFIED_CONTAM: hypothetical protein Slati_2523700 [Sesamum latifolium]|uniref:Uncharacterized protein n=1 Tax=Sesamum latifolium TaxID=2727402 RepID=A0AAW2WFK7_9LAMI